jgi:hypothetical protein
LPLIIIAGRLLIIFEGFDEMDLAMDKKLRLQNFISLWEGFNYKNAKLLFTGRPNFFFDTEEQKRCLRDDINIENNYAQAVHLAFFSNEQIGASLHKLAANTKKDIMDLVDNNAQFAENISRPSILRMVATIWEKKLSKDKERINSARVMDEYIKSTYERQTKKGKLQLYDVERAYFMEAIAVYMVVNDLPNQINSHQLSQVIRNLIKIMPKAVSLSARNLKHDPQILTQRFDFTGNKQLAESIENDVRNCGLLVTDLTKDNTFKFAHKSFMEFLAAKVFADWMVRKESNNQVVESIVNAFKLKRKHIFLQPEIRKFFGEMLANNIKEEDKLKLSKKLFQSLTRFPLFFHRIIRLLTSYKMWLRFKYILNDFDNIAFTGLRARAIAALWINYELWYQTCRSLDIDHDTMAKVVGKSAMV